MTVRRLAIVLSIIAISLFAFNAYNRPSQAGAICVDSRYTPSKIVNACTELIENTGVAPSQMVSYLNYRSWAFRRDDDLEAAISDLDRALELKPDTLRTWINRAYIHDAAGDIDAVVDDFDAALAPGPSRATTFMHRAKLAYLRGDYVLALQDYEAILQLDPDYTLASTNLIAAHLKLENYDLAIDLLNKMAINFPESTGIYAALGRLYYYNSCDYEKALQAFSTMAELAPDSPAPSLYLAMAHFNNGNSELGAQYVADFAKKLLERRPSDATLYEVMIDEVVKKLASSEHFLMGLGYGAIGMPDRARGSLDDFINSGAFLARKTMNDVVNKFNPDESVISVKYPSEEFDQALNNVFKRLEYEMSLVALADELFRSAIR